MNTENLPAIQSEHREMSVSDMMGAIVQRDITPETVAVMKELVTLKRELDGDAAKKAFNRAFVALQRDLRPVVAQRKVPDNNGKTRYVFAAFEDLMAEVAPHIDRHDFGLSFDTKTDTNRICVTATLMHVDGHEKSSDFEVRTSGRGAPGCSDAQTDGGNYTFAKRYALCGLLNIVIDKDNDAGLLGATITPEDAADLERRVKALYPNDARQVERVLKLADAKSFAEIKSAKYSVVIDHIEPMERSRKAPASTGVPPTPEKVFRAALASWSGMTGDDFAQAAREVAKANGIDIKTANAVQFSNLTAFVSEQVANEVDFLAWRSSKK